jgi:ComF family protein
VNTSLSAFALDLAAAALSPSRCAACEAPVSLRAAFCFACAASVERSAWAESGAAFVYGGAIGRAIARLKYDNRPELGRPLGHLLATALQAHASRFRPAGSRTGGGRHESMVVIPVPLHPSRLASRGFNQSCLIGDHVARRLGAQFWPLALGRSRDTPQQVILDRKARIANVSRAFFARNPAAVRGRSILLIDDVRTTGATLDECAHALLAAGAAHVASAAVACALD